MASKWNKAAAACTDKLGPVPPPGKASRNVWQYAGVAVTSVLASRYGLPALSWLNVPHIQLIGLGLLAVALASALAAVVSIGRWQDSRLRAKRQAALAPAQRTLLGLPPTPPAKADPLRQAATTPTLPAATLLGTPITPAQRITPLGAGRGLYQPSPQSAQPLGSAASVRSAATASPANRQSPFNRTNAVATPEQLRRYLDSLPKPPTASPGGDGGVPGRLFEASPDGRRFGGGAAAAAGSADQGEAGGAALSLAHDAPMYRMSQQRITPSEAATAQDGTPSRAAMGKDTAEVIRQTLGVQVPDLLCWTERLREWLSVAVLQSFLGLVDSQHTQVNRMLQDIGQGSTSLPSLADAVNQRGTDIAGALDSSEQLINRIKSCNDERLMPLFLAVRRYQQLLQVLQGNNPRDVLPAIDPPYLLSRLRELAKGTCCKAFAWNGGGRYQGQPWNDKAANDSALVLYMVASFLEAPGWEWRIQGAGRDARGVPLLLGRLDSRPPAVFSGLLSVKPDQVSRGAIAVVGAGLTGTQPSFTILADGKSLALQERDGVFKALLLFLLLHITGREGSVGGRYLHEAAFGGLRHVLDPPDVAATIPQRVFAWWFPSSGMHR